jgi:hypothetical protein
MLERVDFFIREIGAIPVADTGRIWTLRSFTCATDERTLNASADEIVLA